MKRILLKVAYDGTEYVGWQMQPNGVSVEEVLNRTLSELLGETIAVIGASRTDSGVHADGNIAVFDTETRIPADKICFALNQRLPEDIVIKESREVAPDFHPRHVDCTKTYEYTIFNDIHPDPLIRRYAYFVYIPLDVEAMRSAAAYLVGEHDFASFCSAGGQQKTTVREIYGIEISCVSPDDISNERECCGTDAGCVGIGQSGQDKAMHHGAGTIRIRISGNGFLYNMVRIIVGTLVKVGHHVYPPEHVEEILAACDRDLAGPKAPAQGLRLVGIRYQK